jgi:signal transduction histidine kinase
MLGNLLSNALRFTPRGGTITVAAVRGDDGVVLSVSDTGAGISPENLPYLFDRFWQAGRAGVAQGSGLGLAIAKGIVSAHRGRIWVESAIGRGSKFSVFLPGA